MVAWLLLSILSAEPRYLGGAEPSALNKVGPTNDEPLATACTVETLRASVKCHFDARTTPPSGKDGQQRQSKDNTQAAVKLGTVLCQERLERAIADRADRSRREKQCAAQLQGIALKCSLDGADVLFDAEGRFSAAARACYFSLAEIIQLAIVPAPAADQPTTAVQKTTTTDL